MDLLFKNVRDIFGITLPGFIAFLGVLHLTGLHIYFWEFITDQSTCAIFISMALSVMTGMVLNIIHSVLEIRIRSNVRAVPWASFIGNRPSELIDFFVSTKPTNISELLINGRERLVAFERISFNGGIALCFYALVLHQYWLFLVSLIIFILGGVTVYGIRIKQWEDYVINNQYKIFPPS